MFSHQFHRFHNYTYTLGGKRDDPSKQLNRFVNVTRDYWNNRDTDRPVIYNYLNSINFGVNKKKVYACV